jgi:hypothetical protein
LYQQAVDELAAQRPAQAQYIESFFIDPVTGQAGTRVQPAVDYGQFGTMASEREADRANQLAIAQAQAGAGPQNVYNFTPSTEVLVGPMDGGGQESQFYNPDINYDDAFVAESGQQVGVLDPNQAALSAMQAEAGVDPAFYTETPIYSASDFPLGSSLSGADYTTYAPDAGQGAAVTNQFGSTVSSGYDVGQADPRLAAAAGYSPVGAAPQALPTAEQIQAEADMGLDIFGGAGEQVGTAGNLLSDIGNFITSGGITGAALRGVGGALEPALEAAEGGLATLFNDPRTFEERDADRLATEAAMAAMPADESAAVQAQMEAAAVEQEKLKVADPEAFVAQFDQSDQADAVRAVQKAQALSVSPRPPNLTSNKARDWIKANLGINVDKKDATDMIRSLQADWDRQNG